MFLLLSALLLQQDSIPALIEKLGSDAVEERDEASRQLRERVYEAHGELDRASRSADVEVAARARAILEPLTEYRKEVAGELFLLLQHARSEFDDGHFDHCARICDLALLLAPRLEAVEALRWDALEGRRTPAHGDLGRTVELGWVRLPSPELWKGLRLRILRDYPEDDWEEAAVQRKLGTLVVGLSFRETPAEEILQLLGELSGLPLVLDAEVREQVDLGRKLSFSASEQTVDEVLRRLGAEIGLTHAVTGERVVLLSTHSRLRDFFQLDERDPDRY